ncbi:hypothetical protein EDEG_03195, partial [Edhazardia aedis USNM 41457]
MEISEFYDKKTEDWHKWFQEFAINTVKFDSKIRSTKDLDKDIANVSRWNDIIYNAIFAEDNAKSNKKNKNITVSNKNQEENMQNNVKKSSQTCSIMDTKSNIKENNRSFSLDKMNQSYFDQKSEEKVFCLRISKEKFNNLSNKNSLIYFAHDFSGECLACQYKIKKLDDYEYFQADFTDKKNNNKRPDSKFKKNTFNSCYIKNCIMKMFNSHFETENSSDDTANINYNLRNLSISRNKNYKNKKLYHNNKNINYNKFVDTYDVSPYLYLIFTDNISFYDIFLNTLYKDLTSTRVKVMSRIKKTEDAINLLKKSGNTHLVNEITVFSSDSDVIQTTLGLYNLQLAIKLQKILSKDLYSSFITNLLEEKVNVIDMRIRVNKMLNRKKKVLFYMNFNSTKDDVEKYVKENNLYNMCVVMDQFNFISNRVFYKIVLIITILYRRIMKKIILLISIPNLAYKKKITISVLILQLVTKLISTLIVILIIVFHIAKLIIRYIVQIVMSTILLQIIMIKYTIKSILALINAIKIVI